MIDRRLALLLAAAFGLAGYTVWSGDNALFSYLNPQSGDDRAAAAAKVESPPADLEAVANLNPLAGLSAEQFAEIVKRPLFNPSRAPAPEPVAPEPEPVVTEQPPPEEPPVNPEDFVVLGIAERDGRWTVVMRWNPTNEIHRLASGDEVEGWTLASIAPRQVTFTKDGEDLSIKMFEQKNANAQATADDEDSDETQQDNQQYIQLNNRQAGQQKDRQAGQQNAQPANQQNDQQDDQQDDSDE
jgi:hypothetical protein